MVQLTTSNSAVYVEQSLYDTRRIDFGMLSLLRLEDRLFGEDEIYVIPFHLKNYSFVIR